MGGIVYTDTNHYTAREKPLIENMPGGVKYGFSMPSTSIKSKPDLSHNLRALLTLTVLSAYFHAFMEWLFFVTKPSSLSTLSLYEKAKVLFVTGGVLAFLLLTTLLLLSIPGRLVKHPKWHGRLQNLRLLPAAFMLSVAALILLDNFTYTLFKFGIITTFDGWRLIYILIFILILRWMFRSVKRIRWTSRTPASFLTLGLLAASTLGIASIYLSRDPYLTSRNIRLLNSSANRPNIIILGADGLSVSNMSAYGYELETTPFLDELVKSSLVAENAFPNASSTTASTASALTGKEPAEVSVYRYPDILSDEDSFEHLPSILKHQGYKTVEIGTPYYVDAEQLNLLDSFDIINGASQEQPALDALRSVLGNSPSTYFIQMVVGRAAERLLHIFFIQDMENPLEEVNNPQVRMTDAERVDQIKELLDRSNRPLFIFAHFMDTHGPHFSSEVEVFSDESNDEEAEWDVDRYHDAILSFDGHVREIYKYLEDTGKLDNTVLVIYTDHGFKYTVNQRVPIIIHFPKSSHAGVRRNNVQIIDLPVTLLDYLGIARPKWMNGVSMLGDEPPADREIVSIVAGSPRKIEPPFFQIKTVQVIVCQKWYRLNVQENIWNSGMIAGHTAECDEGALPPDEDIHARILEYLQNYGYDIDSLKPPASD
ncbi:MAG: hypothetical protein C3F07_04575 [Anaerolineales bacterium]|nr:MAG: hypothetical protein C3F07_04575 [Anaerolineales bacterium]